AVRVHTGAEADRAARSVSALAFTVGRDIVLRDGQYQPDTTAGRRLLAHELAHVTQQAEGAPPVLRRKEAPGEEPADGSGAAKQARVAEGEKREKLITKLYGLEDLYEKYKSYKSSFHAFVVGSLAVRDEKRAADPGREKAT